MTERKIENQQSPLPIGKEVMEGLKTHIGKPITVQYVWYGVLSTNSETLKRVSDFTHIEIEGSSIPFIGSGSAIRMIVGQDGQVLYDNPLIPDDYDRRSDDSIDEMVRLTFGDEIATAGEKEREEHKRQWQQEQARLNQEAQSKSDRLIEEGEAHVKPELRDEWREYARANTQDFYSAAIVGVSNKVGKALSLGKSPEAAVNAIYKEGLTGFQAGCLARTVSHFHPRGEEFRQWWNRKYLTEEQTQEAKGVVNPAILTLSPKEES